jgi:hypothetical protein
VIFWKPLFIEPAAFGIWSSALCVQTPKMHIAFNSRFDPKSGKLLIPLACIVEAKDNA